MTIPQRFGRYARVLLAASAMILATATAEAEVHYVTQEGGEGTKDGISWTTAYDEAAFPAAIISAGAGDEIWVKAGVYRPSTTNDASESFVLKDGVAVYGGFAGTETSSVDRDAAVNLTVLTGDLNDDDTNKVNGVTTSALDINGTNSTCVVTTSPGCGPATVLDGFTITAGDNPNSGGGMSLENSSPTVTNCAFSGNGTSDRGGGIATSSSNAVFEDCRFSGNIAAEYGGGMYGKGGASTLRRCTFSGNNASQNGGGMALVDGSASAVSDCTFTGNTGDKGGGGMYINSSSPAVKNCTFSANTASGVYGGGGMLNYSSSPAVTNCTFSGNVAANSSGGGMYNTDSSSPTVTNCAFSGNAATYGGGGMFNHASSNPIVTNSAFSANTASDGGGMFNLFSSSPAVTNCTFSGNSAFSDGGGMYNYNGSPTVTNCTFSSNSAAVDGGGMYNEDASVPVVRNCTFSGNSSNGPFGGGMSNAYNTGAPIVTNSVFWGDTGGEIVYEGFSGVAPAVTYSVVQGGYPTGTNIITDDPILGPLADNGGQTQTRALLSGSSAIDKGKTFDASVISTDQRGVARPYPSGGSFDIGAYEYGLNVLTVGITGSGSVTRAPSGDVVGATGKCWSYGKDIVVALTAVEGSRDWFVTWSGDATGTTKTASVTMSGDCYVEASFDDAWLVTVSAGPGGDITPASGAGSSGVSAPGGRGASGTTTVKVRDGANKTFTVTPDGGYSIGTVFVDNVIAILDAGAKYTFTNVTEDHTISATFTANPAPTAVPTTAPTTAPTAAPTATPTPVPTPDPDIPLPKVTLKITLYAGGTVVAGPIDITDPSTLSALLVSPTLLAQLLATDPTAILSGQYNMDLIRFFSLIADLDDGALDFTILFEVTVDNVPAGYRAQLFVLTRTFDSKGNPTGYAIVPRNEGASVFRKKSGARGWTETWRVTVRDGGVTDGDARQDGSVAPQIAAVVAVFPMATPTVTVTPTPGNRGSGGGCTIPESGSAALAALLLLAPVVFLRRR